MDPFRLSATVEHADGSVTRWAEDELDPENQPANLNFTTQNPGGFGTFSLTLPRGLVPGPDEALLDSVTLTGGGGRVAYEGRIHRLPRQQGASKGVTVTGVGWSSHLSDHKAVREIFVDRALTRWDAPMSTQRQTNLLTLANATPRGADSGVTPDDTGAPCITQQWVADWVANAIPVAEARYDSAGIPLGSLYYAWKRGANTGGSAPFRWGAFLADDDTLGSSDATGSLVAAGPGSGTLTATTAGRKQAAVQFYYDNPAANSGGLTYQLLWTALAVYGRHGLAKRGSEPAAGFTASDVIANIITRFAPRLRVGALDDSGYVIPQLAFSDPTTAEQVILEANRTQLYDWFVWDDRTFTMVNPDPDRLTWQARLSDGDEVGLEGDDVVQLASSAYVYFTDVDGRARIYGPTGATGCDYTSDLLLGDGSDPYTQHGIDAPITFTLSTPATPDQALQVGRIWLAEHNTPTRSGQIVIRGLVEHPTEGKVPCWRVRAGDHVQIMDRVGDLPRKIVATSYDHSSRSVTCTTQAGPLFRIEGLLARFGVEIGILG